jgi:hypothetical protein
MLILLNPIFKSRTTLTHFECGYVQVKLCRTVAN